MRLQLQDPGDDRDGVDHGLWFGGRQLGAGGGFGGGWIGADRPAQAQAAVVDLLDGVLGGLGHRALEARVLGVQRSGGDGVGGHRQQHQRQQQRHVDQDLA